MATLNKRKSKRTGKTLYTVQIVVNGRRPCIPLGELTKAQAGEAKGHIERLGSAARTNTTIAATTAAWLADLPDDFHQRLADLGLCSPRQAPEPEAEPQTRQCTLRELLAGYIAERDDVKPATRVVYGHTRRCLVEYFGADRQLNTITAADAKDWRRWLTRSKEKAGQGLAENTARRRCSIAKQFFADAVERELIDRNPFAKMKGISVGANEGRDYFVTRTEADAVLKACPTPQWKLLFALSRYGGLRCPSEHLALLWGDIDFDAGRIVVRSPKTEHHDGKASRVIPLFPELLPYLLEARAELLEDFDPKAKRLSEQPVITHCRDSNANLRTQLLRIIHKAKLTPWPKLFQNLRASRATELAAAHPGHVAAEWLGHSTAIANKHYWRVTEADFERAARAANALQQPTEIAETDGSERSANFIIPLDVDNSRILYICQVGDEGLEPPTIAV